MTECEEHDFGDENDVSKPPEQPKELQQTSNSEFAGGFCTPKDNCPPTAPNCAPKKRTSQDLFEGDSLDMEEDKPDEKRPKVEEGSNQLPSEVSAEEPTITIEFSTEKLFMDDQQAIQQGIEMVLNKSIRIGLPGGTSRDNFNSESSSAISPVKHGYTGIPNMGNTCYFSTIIQCLANCPPLKKYFLSELFKGELNRANPLGCKGVLAWAVHWILAVIWKTGLECLKPEIPKFLKDQIGSKVEQFLGSTQQDAQEFMLTLLDLLHEDLNRIKIPVQVPAISQSEGEPILEPTVETDNQKEKEAVSCSVPDPTAEEAWSAYKLRNDSIIVDLFQGQLKSKLKCNSCEKVSVTYDPFRDLSLPLPPSKYSYSYYSEDRVTLDDCLELFIQPQVLSGDEAWHCPQCNGRRVAEKQISLSRLPEILILTLKRFLSHGPYSRTKIYREIDFPLRHLDMLPYLAEDALTSKEDASYELFAVANHYGDIRQGHYLAIARCPSTTPGQPDECGWRELDDQFVTDKTERTIVSRNAYLLFYRRVHPEQQQEIEQQYEDSSMPSLSPLSSLSSPYSYTDSYSSKSYPLQQHHIPVDDGCDSYEEEDNRYERQKYKKAIPPRKFISPHEPRHWSPKPHGRKNRSPSPHARRNGSTSPQVRRVLISSSPCKQRNGSLRDLSSDDDEDSEEGKRSFGNRYFDT